MPKPDILGMRSITKTQEKLLEDYKEWLMALNYSSSIYEEYPVMVGEMFQFTKTLGVKRLNGITKDHLTAYKTHLETKTSKRTKRKLSNVHINGHLMALRSFAEFLQLTRHVILPVEHLKNLKVTTPNKDVLTREEVEALFKLTEGKNKYRLRDRAMLAVYYGCGLRRNEGICLNVKDIDFTRGYIHVREGKGNKERVVPMSNQVQKHLKEYIKEARPMFTRGKYIRSLFVSNKGTPLDSQSLYKRLKELRKQSDLKNLKQKKIGLHTLRHSIATHLMNNGMDFESISQFLGHSSLDSTQIYTHIDEEIN